MTLPAQIAVSFDFSSSATFGYPFTIGDSKYGILGTSQLAGSSVPAPIVDLTPDVYSISIMRGRNIMRDTYEAGTATVRVLDPNSYFNPQNTSSPYFGYLTPLRKLRISATTATSDSFLFSGYTTEYRYSYDQEQNMGYVDIVCADAFRLMNMANLTTVTDGTAGQATGTRIGKILDQLDFPSNMRTLATGSTTCIADPGTSRTGLEAIKNAEFSEGLGAFYFNTSGTAVYKGRTEVAASLATAPIEFNQTTGIPYKDLKFVFDDKLIINDVTFTRAGGTAQTVFDNDSIAKYFPHGLNKSELVAQTDEIVLNVAREYVATRKETTLRIDAMTVDLLDPSVPTNTMIALDYFDNLLITNVQPDGSTIVKNLQMQGIAWEIGPNKMTAIVTTLEPIAENFIIGSAYYGIIGTSTLGYGA